MPALNQALEAQLQIMQISVSEAKCYEISLKRDKFKNLPERDTKVAIGALLTNRIFEMIGLKPDNFPTKDGAKDIAYFIFKRYPDFTLDDIYNSFEYALAGVITSDTPQKEDWLNHYQSFSIKYFVPILNAYRKYRSNAISRVNKHLDKMNEAREFLDTRRKNSIGVKEVIIMMYQNYIDQNYHKIFTTTSEYDYLDDLGMIETPNSRKREYLAQAKAQILERGKQKREYREYNVQKWIQEKYATVESLAKHKCILELFEELSSFAVQRDILSLILDRSCYIDIRSHEALKHLKNGVDK